VLRIGAAKTGTRIWATPPLNLRVGGREKGTKRLKLLYTKSKKHRGFIEIKKNNLEVNKAKHPALNRRRIKAEKGVHPALIWTGLVTFPKLQGTGERNFLTG